MADADRVCELFKTNYLTVRTEFAAFSGGYMHPFCAALYALAGRTLDAASLGAVCAGIKETTGRFSPFRGATLLGYAAALDLSGDPEPLLADVERTHGLLRVGLRDTAYLPQAAFVIEKFCPPSEREALCRGVTELVRGAALRRPLLAGSENAALFALALCSGRREDEILDRMERCYTDLRRDCDAYAAQALALVLSLGGEDAMALCERFRRFGLALSSKGIRTGRGIELSAAALLSLSGLDGLAAADAVWELDRALGRVKGLGNFALGRKRRAMFCCLLASALADGAPVYVPGRRASFAPAELAAEAALFCALSVCAGSSAAMRSTV